MWKTFSAETDTSIETVALLDGEVTDAKFKSLRQKIARLRPRMNLEKWGQLSRLVGKEMAIVARQGGLEDEGQ
ncbi:hypothetical protein F53441_13134 [Fusarium austroafricanum]|uniref:Uncharacterized protein n=1 Tax=Fusarium austroafricanum TaxID=2364996 RepID=A0A8H4NGK8_9HYPO|nr:hypothetical protein F53441_13134 [Fusarium austroafricanum]